MKIQQKIAIGFIRTKINMLRMISHRKAAEETLRVFLTPMMKSRIKEKEVFSRAEPIQFTLNDVLIKGFRCNHPKKHKVLLLHGFSSTCHNFDKYVAPLLEKNYEVLAFDAPAHGSSEGETVNAVEYSMMIKKITEFYGPINGYIAHSFGGIAVCLALEAIPHDAKTKLVLIAPATETSSAVDGAFAMLGIKNEKLRKTFDELVLEKSGRETSWFSVRRAMNNIRASVLWFHDEDDDITPLADAIKVKSDNHSNIKFVFTKGLGHRKIYRDEAVLNAAVKFL
ncbi:MAG: alpha/beta hydrolase [Ferruginibacter sp.]